MKLAKQKGFTLVEAVITGAALLTVTVGGAVVWALFHFISKYW